MVIARRRNQIPGGPPRTASSGDKNSPYTLRASMDPKNRNRTVQKHPSRLLFSQKLDVAQPKLHRPSPMLEGSEPTRFGNVDWKAPVLLLFVHCAKRLRVH